MAAEEKRVVLDTDFINTITKYQTGDSKDFFHRIFCTLGVQPVVHPYIAEYELENNKIAQELIAAGDIIVIPYDAFLPPAGTRRTFYVKSFHDLHRIIPESYVPQRDKPEMFPLRPDEDIFARQAGRSFGEIHSILMAVELEIPVLFSDDKGAKTAATRYAVDRLIVQSAIEVADLLQDQPEITGSERRYLRKCYEHRK